MNKIFASINDAPRRDAVMFFAGHTSGAPHLK
jgi:hypothetical protein